MVQRRYTPPTCTLEIKAKESPLSRWAGKSVTTMLSFDLSFDDPTQSEEKRARISGDRFQLEALQEAVTNYVQEFLAKDPDQISLLSSISAVEDSEPATFSLPSKSFQPSPFTSETATDTVEQTGNDFLQPTEASVVSPGSNVIPFPEPQNQSPYLQPKGLLTHDLILGSLQTEESGPSISLTGLQLFDLATALDQYAADMISLPPLSNNVTWWQATPLWTRVAALVVLVAGVSTAAVTRLNQSPPTTQVAIVEPAVLSSPNPEAPIVGEQLPPNAQTPVNPQITPLPMPGGLPSPQATTPVTQLPNGIAPPPPPLNSTGRFSPPPVAIAPVQPPVNQPTLTIPRNVKIPPYTQQPVIIPRTVTVQPPLRVPPATSPRRVLTPPPVSSSPVLIPRTFPVPRNAKLPSATNTPSQLPDVSDLPEEVASAPSTVPVNPSPELPPAPKISDRPSADNLQLDTSPQSSSNPTNPSVGTLAEESRQNSTTQAAPNLPAGIARSRANDASIPVPSSSVEKGQESSQNLTRRQGVSDNLPQITEVRNFFQQRWKPPTGLAKTLEYNLVLNANGSIQRIIPLGEASGVYIDRTNMPLTGEPFVSPIEGGRTARIRLVLAPDGKVQTFLEGTN